MVLGILFLGILFLGIGDLLFRQMNLWFFILFKGVIIHTSIAIVSLQLSIILYIKPVKYKSKNSKCKLTVIL